MRKLVLGFCLVSSSTSHAQLLAELLWVRVPMGVTQLNIVRPLAYILP